MNENKERIKILGVPVDMIDKEQAFAKFESSSRNRE